MDTWLQDARYGIRMLRKSPGFTAIAVLSLALGIGANVTIFSWIKAVILDPIPGARDTSELITINRGREGAGGYSNSYPQYEYIRDNNTVFSGLVAYELQSMNLSSGDKPELLYGGVVTGNYFDVLGMKPAVGRTFLPAEGDVKNPQAVAVLSYGFWQRRFHGDPAIVGKTISINRHTFTVIGVGAKGFAGTYGGLAMEIFVPLANRAFLAPGGAQLDGPSWMQIMARLKPGVSVEQAQANLHVLAKQFAERNPKFLGWDFDAYPILKSQRGFQSDLAELMPVLAAIVGIVLLIACANVANLLLGRAAARSKEMAIRVAVGASRGRLARQILVESMLLSVAAGVIALLLAFWTSGSLTAFVPNMGAMSLAFNFVVDYRVVLFTLGITILTGLLFGMVPALQPSTGGIAGTLKDEAGSVAGAKSKSYLRKALVVTQIGLSVVALVAAGLLVRTLQRALLADTGFNTGNLLCASYNLYLNGYTETRGRDFDRQLMTDLKALPGVQAVSMASFVPMSMSGGGNSRRYEIEGYVPGKGEDMSLVTDAAGPDFLQAMQIPLAEGRDFTMQDNDSAPPVVVINQAMANRFWPGQSALGKRVKVDDKWREVVGVSRNFVYRSIAYNDPSSPQVYLPVLQSYESAMTLVVRTAGDPGLLFPVMQSRIRQLDANLPLFDVETMRQRIVSSMFEQGIAARLLAVFGVLALCLAAIGLYGVIAYFVTQRTHEIGVRVALGARPRHILDLVMGEGLRMSLLGIAIGLIAALGIARLLKALLVGVSASDPLTFGGIALLLVAVAVAASLIPARRAMQVEPMSAIRYQ